MTAYGTVESAVEAMETGRLRLSFQTARHAALAHAGAQSPRIPGGGHGKQRIAAPSAKRSAPNPLIGTSEGMLAVARLIEVANSG